MGDRWLKRVGLAFAAGLLALPLIPLMVASSSPVSTTINAQADSFASSWAPVSNYGRNQTLRTHGSWPTRYAFLRFNVPSGSISKATLYLYSWTTNSRGVSVHPATSSWSERRVTYRSRPAMQRTYVRSGSVRAITSTPIGTGPSASGASTRERSPAWIRSSSSG